VTRAITAAGEVAVPSEVAPGIVLFRRVGHVKECCASLAMAAADTTMRPANRHGLGAGHQSGPYRAALWVAPAGVRGAHRGSRQAHRVVERSAAESWSARQPVVVLFIWVDPNNSVASHRSWPTGLAYPEYRVESFDLRGAVAPIYHGGTVGWFLISVLNRVYAAVFMLRR